MKIWQFAALAAFLSLAGNVAASAQSPIPIKIERGQIGGSLDDGKIYAVNFKCDAQGDLHGAIDNDFFATRTRTFAVVLSGMPSVGKSDGTSQLPDGALAVIQAFSVDKSTTFVDRRNCDYNILITGGKRLYLIGAMNVLTDFTNSPAGTIFDNLASLLTPLVTLFTGNPLPAIIAGKISNLQSAKAPIQNILNALNQGKNYTTIEDNVRVGAYKVRTEYGGVTVTVRPIPSLVLDKDTIFRADFRSQIAAAPDKIDIANVDKSCSIVRAALTESSFTSRTDIAYALIALGAKAGFSQYQIMQCLTRDYEQAAVAMPDDVWSGFPAGLRFTQEEFDAQFLQPTWPQQPTFAVIKPRLDQMVTSLAQYARNNPPKPVAVAKLKSLMADKISIIDNTSAGSISDSQDPVDWPSAINLLKAKGYIRFGCYAPTTEDTDLSVDGATSMFLTFNESNDAVGSTVDKALAIRPIYKGLKVTSLIVSLNRTYITAVLTARNYVCDDDFVVAKPKPAQ